MQLFGRLDMCYFLGSRGRVVGMVKVDLQCFGDVLGIAVGVEQSQKAIAGTAIHCSSGATPVPSNGKTGIKSE